MKYLISGILLSGLLQAPAIAGENPFHSDDKAACMDGPMAQFGRYIGDWKITDETLAQDGSGWGPGNAERWIFTCIGGGIAVQDYWLPKTGGFGTNLRTYDTGTGKWEIVWAAKGQNGLMHISAAQNDEGDIVMDVLSPVQDPPRRIIFFAPQDNSWNWAMQWSFDEGKTWADVYRIVATPWK